MRLPTWTRGVRRNPDANARRGTGDGPPTTPVILLLLLLAAGTAAGLPLRTNDDHLSVSDTSRALVFLTRYGYLLHPSDPRTGDLRSETEFREAVKTMQRFGGLTPTGRIDMDTMALMGARRCGVPDLLPGWDRHVVRRYAIQGQKWPSTHLTWSVRSDAEDAGMVRGQLRRAFGVWSEASALRFQEMQESTSTSADIVVSFLKGQHGDGYPFDGEGSVLAHAFFPGEGIGGDAHFDAEERWTPVVQDNDDNGVNLFAVAAHEIGHSLGLSHSSTPGSLMFPYYQLITGDSFRLPKDDAEGIRHLYGVKNPDGDLATLAPFPLPELPVTTTREAPVTTSTTTEPRTKVISTPTPKSPAVVPDICNSSIDAISVIRREIFVFKGNYFWRLHTNRTLRSGYPVSIDRFWYDLPPTIDALYERPTDTKIVFFSGRNHWLFSANRLEPGYPKPLTELGLPEDLERVDAALVWGHNGRTYLFGGDRYWKLDESEGKAELDYPRGMVNAWRGVPAYIDAAFQWTDGNTYFFKDNKFWKFVDMKMRVEKKSPSEIGGFWFQCPSKTMESATTTITSAFDPHVQQSSVANNNNSWTFHIMSYLYLLFLIHFWYTYCRITVM